MSREIMFRAWDGIKPNRSRSGEYSYVKAAWHPNATKRGYVLEHRLILEAYMGFYLPKYAIVHHKNGDKKDNRIENLEYLPDQKFHAKKHDSGIRNSNNQFVANSPEFELLKFRLFNKHTRLFEIHTLGKLIKTAFRNSQFSFAGRWTGLKDKNGKEIYEGDIVQFVEAGDAMSNDYTHRREVKFMDGGFTPFCNCWKPDALFDSHETGTTLIEVSRKWNWSDHFKFEVIGNIYQNKDLLTL